MRFFILFFIIPALLLVSCSSNSLDKTPIATPEYTILKPYDYPFFIEEIINEKCNSPIFHTYLTEDALYIIISYGIQDKGGYTIVIEELFESKNAIFVSSMLKGPNKNEDIPSDNIPPTIVLKLPPINKNVIFE